ncbi:MAG TPA: hypothetical protein DDW27_14190 [Bacteroidales bacterium]|nr:hypothetical protein [Bacteroidales bacterium]
MSAQELYSDFKRKTMKYFIISMIFFFGLSSVALSQDDKFVLRTGAGYYTDVMAWYDGPVLWLEGGYRFNTGFYLNARASVATIDWKMNEGIFADYKTIALRQMADITFSRPINLSGQHYLEPGLGFKLKREYHLLPEISFDEISGQTYIYTNYSYIFYEIGFTLCLDYYYKFPGGFCIGFRTDSNVIWALGFEGLTLSPLFGFRF